MKEYRVWLSVAAFFLSLSACFGTSPDKPTGKAQKNQSASVMPAVSDTGQLDPLAQMAHDLRQLLIDLSMAKLCKHVEGSIVNLSRSGATVEDGLPPAVGIWWVHACRATPVDPTHLRLQLAGKGWKWVSRKKSRWGATFEVDHYVRFSVDLSLVATANLAYDPIPHIVTGWLWPTEPVQAEVNSLGNIPVNSEGLWAAIVGGAASWIGMAPSEMAESQIAQKGGQRFEHRLSEGFGIAYNLCTGWQTTYLGTLPPGQMPGIPLDSQSHLQRGSGRSALYPHGLMLYGPFKPASEIVAHLALSDGAVHAQWLCEDTAQELYQAYLNEQQPLPEVEVLQSTTIRGQAPVLLQAHDPGCPVVLAVRPLKGRTPAHFEWGVSSPKRGFEPVVSCQ